MIVTADLFSQSIKVAKTEMKKEMVKEQASHSWAVCLRGHYNVCAAFHVFLTILGMLSDKVE